MLDFGHSVTVLQSPESTDIRASTWRTRKPDSGRSFSARGPGRPPAEVGHCRMSGRHTRMTRQQHVTLARFLLQFVETHPGTRFGQMFGHPAAFAGTRAFAEVTSEGLSCRLPREAIGRGFPVRARLRPGPHWGWFVITDPGVGSGTLLEIAAFHAATGLRQRRARSTGRSSRSAPTAAESD